MQLTFTKRRRTSWSEDEDEDAKLKSLVNLHGLKWANVAKALGGRRGKQCRERWNNHLNPDVSQGPWTAAEDSTIFEMQAAVGNQWANISKMVPGRTEHAVKNRYYSMMSKNCGHAPLRLRLPPPLPPPPRAAPPAAAPPPPTGAPAGDLAQTMKAVLQVRVPDRGAEGGDRGNSEREDLERQMERQQHVHAAQALAQPPLLPPQAQPLLPPHGVADPGPVIPPPPPTPVATPYNEVVAALNNDLHKMYKDRKNWFEQVTFQAGQLRQKHTATYHNVLEDAQRKQAAAVARLEKARAGGGEDVGELEMVLVRINEELQKSEATWTSKTKDLELKVDAKLKDGQTTFYNQEAQIRARHSLPPPSTSAQSKNERGLLLTKTLDALHEKTKRETKAAREERERDSATFAPPLDIQPSMKALWERQPTERCGLGFCFYTTRNKGDLQLHLEAVHGGDELKKTRDRAEVIRKKQRAFLARRPGLVCAVEGCGFKGKFKASLEEHLVREHGGEVDEKVAAEIEGMKEGWRTWSSSSWVPSWPSRPKAGYCGVDGCEFQTKYNDNLKNHQACVHGIGDVRTRDFGRDVRLRIPVVQATSGFEVVRTHESYSQAYVPINSFCSFPPPAHPLHCRPSPSHLPQRPHRPWRDGARRRAHRHRRQPQEGALRVFVVLGRRRGEKCARRTQGGGRCAGERTDGSSDGPVRVR
jgi:hypothetical protein